MSAMNYSNLQPLAPGMSNVSDSFCPLEITTGNLPFFVVSAV
jgi:hypothetical protein